MKIILRQDIEKVGRSGDIIQVKDGYARNFLIPKGLAIQATPSNLNKLTEEKKKREQQLEKEKNSALELAARLKGLSVNVAVETYEEDKLYGSVTASDIASALEEEDIKIDRKCIILKEPIKTLGIFDCTVRLYPQVETEIKIWVVKR